MVRVALVCVLMLGIAHASRLEAQPLLPPLQVVDTSSPQGTSSYPTRLAVDAAGNMYVIDEAQTHVKVFSAAGVYQGSIGGPGTDDGKFLDPPTDVALTRDGRFLYVADNGNLRVQKFDTQTGAFVLKFGESGQSNGQFHNRIMSLAVDSMGHVYVGSVFQLQKFNSDGDWQETFELGGILPSAMAVDVDDNLIFFEGDGGRFYKYDPSQYDPADPWNALLGQFFLGYCNLSDGYRCIDPDGDGPLQLGDGQLWGGPSALAVDVSGNIYVTDNRNFRVQKLSPDGTFVWKLGTFGTGGGQFGGQEGVGPYGVALDDAGHIYVVDPENHRIQIFTEAHASPSSLGIDDVTVMEGDTGTTPAVFTVTLTPASASAVTVDYATADVTAQAGTDYVSTQGRLTFAPGETTKTIPVLVNGNTVMEGNRRFAVNLSNPTNATLAVSQGIGDIVDDDVPTISIADAQRREGNRRDRTLVFTLSLSSPVSVPVTVQWSTADGTATAGSDYEAVSQATATFPAGATTTTIGVRLLADLRTEADETFAVILSHPVNAVVGRAQATGTIVNDDQPSADLALTVSSDQRAVSSGEWIGFEVAVTNLGPDVSSGFRVSGQTTQQPGTILGTGSTSGMLTCTTTAQRFDCVAPPGTIALAPGETLRVLVDIQAPSVAAGVRRTGLSASVSSATPADPLAANDRGEATVLVNSTR